MEVERFFFNIKDNIVRGATELFSDAAELAKEGQAEQASQKADQAKAELLKTSVVDEVLPFVLTKFSEAGIDVQETIPQSNPKPPPIKHVTPKVGRRIVISEAPTTSTEKQPTDAGQKVSRELIPVEELEKSAIGNLITAKGRLALLHTLFKHSDEPLHVRELTRRTSLEMNQVRRELEIFEKAGLVINHWERNRRLYQLDPNSPDYEPFLHLFTREIVALPAIQDDVQNEPSSQPIESEPEQARNSLLPGYFYSPRTQLTDLAEKVISGSTWKTIVTGLSNMDLADERILSLVSNRIAGRLFEEFGFQHLQNLFANSRRFLLTPAQTAEIYCQLNPGRQVMTDEFGITAGVKGISVPDGLLVSDNSDYLVLEAAIDYKSSPKDLASDAKIMAQLAKYSYTNTASALYMLTKGTRAISQQPDFLHNICPNLSNKPLIMHSSFGVILGVPENTVMNNTIEGIATIEKIPVDTRVLNDMVNLALTTVSINP